MFSFELTKAEMLLLLRPHQDGRPLAREAAGDVDEDGCCPPVERGEVDHADGEEDKSRHVREEEGGIHLYHRRTGMGLGGAGEEPVFWGESSRK